MENEKITGKEGKSMEEKTCFIVGAGSFDGLNVLPQKNDLVIAADGGYRYLKREGIEPQVLLGDFDSLERVPEHEHLVPYSPIKDDTDMALAAAYGREQGCRRFYLYGSLGGRLDHSIANFQLMTGFSKAGMEMYLIGEGVMITAITKERICFPKEASGMISVFSMDNCSSGIWERGLKYTLQDAELTNDRTLGISNEFLGQESSIEVREGTLLILWDLKNGFPVQRVRI